MVQSMSEAYKIFKYKGYAVIKQGRIVCQSVLALDVLVVLESSGRMSLIMLMLQDTAFWKAPANILEPT